MALSSFLAFSSLVVLLLSLLLSCPLLWFSFKTQVHASNACDSTQRVEIAIFFLKCATNHLTVAVTELAELYFRSFGI